MLKFSLILVEVLESHAYFVRKMYILMDSWKAQFIEVH